MSSRASEFPSFLSVMFHSCIYLVLFVLSSTMDAWVASTFGPLLILLLWTWVYCIYLSPWFHSFYVYISSGIVGSYGSSVFSFLRNQMVKKIDFVLHTFYHNKKQKQEQLLCLHIKIFSLKAPKLCASENLWQLN